MNESSNEIYFYGCDRNGFRTINETFGSDYKVETSLSNLNYAGFVVKFEKDDKNRLLKNNLNAIKSDNEIVIEFSFNITYKTVLIISIADGLKFKRSNINFAKGKYLVASWENGLDDELPIMVLLKLEVRDSFI